MLKPLVVSLLTSVGQVFKNDVCKVFTNKFLRSFWDRNVLYIKLKVLLLSAYNQAGAFYLHGTPHNLVSSVAMYVFVCI